MKATMNTNANNGNESDSDFIEVSPVDIKTDQELMTDQLQSNVGSVTMDVQKLDQRINKLQKVVNRNDENTVERLGQVTVSVLDARRLASLEKRTNEQSIKDIAGKIDTVKEEINVDISQMRGSINDLQKNTKEAQHQFAERISHVEITTTEAIKEAETLEITVARIGHKVAASDIVVSKQSSDTKKLAAEIDAMSMENSSLRSRLAKLEAKSSEQERKLTMQQEQMDRDYHELRMEMQRQKAHMLACEAIVRNSQQTLATQAATQADAVQKTTDLTSRVDGIQATSQDLKVEVAALANAQRQSNATKRIIARDCQDLNDKVRSEAECLNNLGSAVAAFARSSCSQILELKRDVALLTGSIESVKADRSVSSVAQICQAKNRWVALDDMPFYGSATPAAAQVEHDERICFGFGDNTSSNKSNDSRLSKISTTSHASMLLDSPLPKIQNFGKVMSPIRSSNENMVLIALKHALTVQEGFSDRFEIHLNQPTALIKDQMMCIHSDSTVAMVKRSIVKALPSIGSNFELLFNSAQLPEHKTVKQCGIESSCEILIAIIV